jgi:hypothetical protein
MKKELGAPKGEVYKIDQEALGREGQGEGVFEGWKNSFGRAVTAGGSALKRAANLDFGDEFAKDVSGTIRETGTALAPVGAAALTLAARRFGVTPTLLNTVGSAVGGMIAAGGAKDVSKRLGASEAWQQALGDAAGMGTFGTAAVKGLPKTQALLAPLPKGGQAHGLVKEWKSGLDKAAGVVDAPLMDRAKRRWSEAMRQVTEIELPFNDQLERREEAAGLPKMMRTGIEAVRSNLQRVARRPANALRADLDEIGFMDPIRKLGQFDTEEATGLDQAGRYLGALRENELLTRWLQKKPGGRSIQALPEGVDKADLWARAKENLKIIEELDHVGRPVAQKMQLLRDKLLQVWDEGELKTPAELKKLREQKHWVKFDPARTEEEELLLTVKNAGKTRTRQVAGIGGETVADRLATDLRKDFKNPIQATLEEVQNAYRLAKKNKLMLQVAKNASQEVAGPNGQKQLKHGVYKDIVLSDKPKDGSQEVWVKGEKKYLTGPPDFLNDLVAADAISAASNEFTDGLTGLVSTVPRLMKSGITGALAPWYKPVAVMSNIWQVAMNLPWNVSGKVIKDAVPYTWETMKFAMGAKPKGQFAQLLKEGHRYSSFGTVNEALRGDLHLDLALEAQLGKKGVATPFLRFTVVDPLKELAKGPKKWNTQVLGQFRNGMDHFWRTVEDVVSADDAGMRAAIAKNMKEFYLKKGYSPEMAREIAHDDAANVLVDFTKRGARSHWTNMVGLPYFMSALNGLRSTAKYAKRDPKAFAARAAVPLGIYGAMAMFNYNDPKKAEALADMTPEFKSRHFIFFTGEPYKKNGRWENVLVVRAPEAMFALNAMADYVAANAMPEERLVSGMSTLVAMANALTPFGETDKLLPSMAAAVPIAGPLLEASETVNKDFFSGAPVLTEKKAKEMNPAVRELIGDKWSARLAHVAGKTVPSLGAILREEVRNPEGGKLGAAGEIFRRRYVTTPGGFRKEQMDGR